MNISRFHTHRFKTNYNINESIKKSSLTKSSVKVTAQYSHSGLKIETLTKDTMECRPRIWQQKTNKLSKVSQKAVRVTVQLHRM